MATLAPKVNGWAHLVALYEKPLVDSAPAVPPEVSKKDPVLNALDAQPVTPTVTRKKAQTAPQSQKQPKTSSPKKGS